jgi:hypothetical protein
MSLLRATTIASGFPRKAIPISLATKRLPAPPMDGAPRERQLEDDDG